MTDSFIERFKETLSGKWITLLILLISILSRMIQLIFFYNMRDDASYQVMATQNFVNGNGISLARVLPRDLSHTIYEPLINWPPGYSFLLAPFYLIFNQNYLPAAITVDILAAVLLIFISRALLKLFQIHLSLINLFTLLTSFFIYYFYFIASSDAIAVTFFIVALYYSLLIVKNKRHYIKHVVLISVSLLLCGYLKYLFIPVTFIIPGYFIIKGIIEKNKIFQIAGITTFLFIAIGISALLLYNTSVSGKAAFISAPGRGFFPEHLLLTYPFIPASFIKPDTFGFISNNLEKVIYIIYQFINTLLLLIALAFVIKRFNNRKNLVFLKEDYYTLLCIVVLTITGLLSYLSIRVEKEEILPGWFWTYVEEPRYYGLATVMIHLGIFIIYKYEKIRKAFAFIFYLAILFLFIEFCRGSIFVGNRIKNLGKEEYSWQLEYRFQKYASSIINSAKEKYKTDQVVVTSSEIYFSNRVSIYNHVPVLEDAQKINNKQNIKTKKPTILIVIIKKAYEKYFSSYLLDHKQDIAGEFKGYTFYTTYVAPI